MKQGRQHRARQHKEAWAKFEPDLAKYNRKKVEWEDKNRRVDGRTNNSPYTRIRELAEDLKAIPHLDEEQERLREIIRSTTL